MAAHETAAAASKYQPSDFLKAVLGRPVIVKLNSGVSYRGILACLDGYMNIAMEQTEEYARRGARETARARAERRVRGRARARGDDRAEATPPRVRAPRAAPDAPRRPQVDGQLKAKYGDCFIRGNNVHYISTIRRPKG